ncbi:MAG: hypothetical protein REI64_14200 [Pedobacter sp.]|uniref:hypothetical protein n=1 Tax=Pedobacter sp. TaxID=1411316 RepID=UPI0028072300|nr:hypothetical protein [Pedobacter sp.]MDQ8005951.1 hypothetical protein [Pedobacter sp.]
MKFNFKIFLFYLVYVCISSQINYSFASTAYNPKPIFFKDTLKPFFQFRSGNTLFQNVQTYITPASATIEGEIYCINSSVYTFDFVYDGNGGSYTVITPGSNTNLFITNGRAVRKVTMNLSPGVNHFSVILNFNGASQFGYAGLKIDQIDGVTSGNEIGFVDLIIQAQSELQEMAGSSSYHWVCKGCHMINSTSTSICIDCGKSRH